MLKSIHGSYTRRSQTANLYMGPTLAAPKQRIYTRVLHSPLPNSESVHGSYMAAPTPNHNDGGPICMPQSHIYKICVLL
jgi:hypothetical protein